MPLEKMAPLSVLFSAKLMLFSPGHPAVSQVKTCKVINIDSGVLKYWVQMRSSKPRDLIEGRLPSTDELSAKCYASVATIV